MVSGVCTLICNVNCATSSGFLSGSTTTVSETTMLSMVRFSPSKTSFKTVEVPLTYIAVLIWYSVSVGDCGIWKKLVPLDGIYPIDGTVLSQDVIMNYVSLILSDSLA